MRGTARLERRRADATAVGGGAGCLGQALGGLAGRWRSPVGGAGAVRPVLALSCGVQLVGLPAGPCPGPAGDASVHEDAGVEDAGWVEGGLGRAQGQCVGIGALAVVARSVVAADGVVVGDGGPVPEQQVHGG